MKFFRSQTASPRSTPYHPETVIREMGDGDAIRIADAQTGAIVFGATGSGKTSGPGKFLALGYLAAGFGGVVLCSKKDECPQWVKWATDAGRLDDLVIINTEDKWRFNFLDWEASRPGEGGGLSINIVNMLDEIALAISGSEEHSANSKFWEDSLHHMNTNLVDLVLLAGLQVSMPLLRSIVTTGPYSPDQVNDPEWKRTSACAAIIEEADKATAKADPLVRADFQECRDYWLIEFPNLSEKTRSIITLTFSILARPLITRPLRQIFSADTNITPEATFEGKVIVVDIPVQEYRLVGRIANLIIKYCFQVGVLRRIQPTDRKSFLRPVFLWADEAQMFVTRGDAEYQAVARSAGGCTVYLTQNRESFRRVLKNNDAVDSLLGNLSCKIFCQNAGETNDWASKLLGERYVRITSTNAGVSRQSQLLSLVNNSANQNAGITRIQDKRYFVEQAAFTTLKRGGAKHNFHVEAIIYNGGHIFKSPSGEAVPYKQITFRQT